MGADEEAGVVAGAGEAALADSEGFGKVQGFKKDLTDSLPSSPSSSRNGIARF